MEIKRKKHYPESCSVKKIFRRIGSEHIGVFIKFQGKEMVHVKKSALFDLLVALRADDTEKIDYFLKAVKTKLKESSEGGESV